MWEDLVEQHERLGRAVTSIIAEFAASLDTRRVASEATPADLQKLFDEPLPEKGIGLDEILLRFRNDVAAHAMIVPSPRYFGQFNLDAFTDRRVGGRIGRRLKPKCRAWRNGPTSAMIEARVMRWLCDLIGYGTESFGTLASGGSEANLIALKCARDSADAAIVHRGVRQAPTDLVIDSSEQFTIHWRRVPTFWESAASTCARFLQTNVFTFAPICCELKLRTIAGRD